MSDIDHLRAVVGMPFLKSAETLDLLVVRAMNSLSKGEMFAEVLNHPKVRWGSEPSWGTLVVAASTVINSSKVARLLDTAYVESGSVESTYTEEVKVDIVRTGKSKPATIELVYNAILSVEEAMDKPLPVDHIILVLSDESVREGTGGRNFGSAISFRPKYEDPSDSHLWGQLETGLIHEVAHYFWRGNADWIDEGMANITEYIYNIERGLSPVALKPRRKGCESHDLKMLSEWAVHQSDGQFACNYFMGETLFIDLLDALGMESFVRRSHELYKLAPAGIEQLRQVFYDQTDIVEHYWSSDWNAPENRNTDDGIERRSHLAVQWDLYPEFDSDTNMVSFKGVLLGNAVLRAPHISVAREGKPNFVLRPFDKTGWSGNILPYFTDGTRWKIDGQSGSTVATVYDISSQSFRIEFPFPSVLGNPTDYVIEVKGFRNNDRVPEISTTSDNLGYARIRVD